MSPQTANPLQTAWEDLTAKQAVAAAHKAAADHAVAQATEKLKDAGHCPGNAHKRTKKGIRRMKVISVRSPRK